MTPHRLERSKELDDDEAPLQAAALLNVEVQRLQRSAPGRASLASDQVVVEAPVALCFNGLSHAVMMATPTSLPALGLGFALSEGIIDTPDQCRDLAVVAHEHGTEVQMHISTRAFEALKQRRRSMEGRSGCGLCGVDSLQALHETMLPARRHGPALPQVDLAAVLAAFAHLPSRQVLNQHTGGCHAAGWALPDGQLLAVHEDIGRHNALDKLIGLLAADNLLGTPGFVVMSSRASYELVRKCAQVGIGTLATISAPSSMAIQVARQTGIGLLGFCRADGAVLYT